MISLLKKWRYKMIKYGIGKIMYTHVSDAIKDVALEVCIASGEEDIILDMDTVNERMPQESNSDINELMKIIEKAKAKDVGYIHLY